MIYLKGCLLIVVLPVLVWSSYTGKVFAADCNRNGIDDAQDLLPHNFLEIPPTRYLEEARTLVAADLNGDGKPDLASARSQDLSVLLSNGDGTFRQAVSYPLGRGLPVKLIAADLNGDEKPDLALTYWIRSPIGSCVAPDFVDVLLNRGDGTFEDVIGYAVGDGTQSLIVADLDDDGKLDLVTASIGICCCRDDHRMVVSLLLNSGDGTFKQAVSYPFIRDSLIASDFNGDGGLDLAGVSDSIVGFDMSRACPTCSTRATGPGRSRSGTGTEP